MSDRRITIIKRDDVDLQLTFTDVDGNPINLTDGTVFFTVKRSVDDPDADAIISKTIEAFDNPTTGIMVVSLSNTDTDKTPGSYYFDVQFKDSEDKISSSERGKFLIEKDVTIRTS